MKNYTPHSVVIGLFLALQGAAYGALVWESTDADLHPSLSDKKAVAHFKYKNTGDKPVKITSVHPSCGCTTAALAKDVVGPNESGEITATFNIGDRSGVQTKTITVQTDDRPAKPTILKLKATIPQLLQISPAFVYWSAGDVLRPENDNGHCGPGFSGYQAHGHLDRQVHRHGSRTRAGGENFSHHRYAEESGRPINAALKIEPDFPKEAPKSFTRTCASTAGPNCRRNSTCAASLFGRSCSSSALLFSRRSARRFTIGTLSPGSSRQLIPPVSVAQAKVGARRFSGSMPGTRNSSPRPCARRVALGGRRMECAPARGSRGLVARAKTGRVLQPGELQCQPRRGGTTTA